MTKLLEQAFEKASRLPQLEQELLASRLLAELAPISETVRPLPLSQIEQLGLLHTDCSSAAMPPPT